MGEGAPPSSDASRRDAQPSPAEPGGRRFKFRNAVLDERSMELRVDGKRVALERKPLEALHYFILHAGEIVTKAELSESLWPGRILTETTVTGCIRKIRSAVGDVDHDLIKTVHGFGYRFADALRVEHCASSAIDALNLSVGDRPPRRPQWELTEKLGVGGHGEAWLARHEKTGDCRVFKFALNKEALAALKREITLYRLLHDSLGQAVAVVRIFEWNLEEEPYYIETEYVEGRDLASWGTSQGKLTDIPLEQRLDLVAQIAQALAAAHSVGVLHKDLKPRNVLVKPGPRPTIKLCDFGSGSVLDGRRLDALGITRLGFTQTLNAGEISGTPLYLAPEIIAGQPFTVRADVYPLGVMLYQCIVGDLKRPLATGWESDIADELLCEDIVLATSGNPDRRTVSAAELAERLYTLELRRAARAEEKAAREKAERARRISEQLRRTRAFAFVSVILAAMAVFGGVTAHRARNDAVAATATAKAVSDFLTEDVLNVDSAIERPREASYESLLTRAASRVDIRFKQDLGAATRIHDLLGRRFQEIGRLEAAQAQYEKAAALSSKLYGPSSQEALLAFDRLARIYGDSGRFEDAYAVYDELRRLWEDRGQRRGSLAMLMIRARAARLLTFSGELRRAESELRDILSTLSNMPPRSSEAITLFEHWYGTRPSSDKALYDAVRFSAAGTLGGNVLAEFGEEYTEGELLARDALAASIRAFGEESEQAAISRIGLAFVLTGAGAHTEAEALFLRCRAFFENWLPARHFYHGLPLIGLARLRLEQQRGKEALDFALQALNTCNPDSCNQAATATYYWDLGRAYVQQGRFEEGISAFKTALPINEDVRGVDHIGSIRIRLSLAEALRTSGRHTEASQALTSIGQGALMKIRENHPAIAEFRRSMGLLALRAGDFEGAEDALSESLRLLLTRLNEDHWKVKRAKSELALAGRRQ